MIAVAAASPLEEQPVAPLDRDLDGVPDASDSCPDIANGAQLDADHDAIGDVCDTSNAAPGPLGGVRVVLRVVAGRVLVRLPPAKRFRLLRGAELVSVGAIVDTRQGVVRLTSAAGPPAGRVETIVLSGGVFRFFQTARRHAFTVIKLRIPAIVPCPRPSAPSAVRAARVSPTRARLSADGSGRFRIRGRQSASTATGTRWITEERCEGTLTRVISHRVAVTDLRRHATVLVSAGHSYLARSHGPR